MTGSTATIDRPAPLLDGEILFVDQAGVVVRSVRVRVPNSPRGRRQFLAHADHADEAAARHGLVAVPLPPAEFAED